MNASNLLDMCQKGEIKRYAQNEIPLVLYKMKIGEISREQLREIVSVRYQAAHFFEDMLRHMLRKIDSGLYRGGTGILSESVKLLFRNAVASNLQDELGETEYGGPHCEGRKVLLEALGFNYDKWKAELGSHPLDEAARHLVEKMKETIEEGAVEAVAALSYYEDRISLRGRGDYCILLKALERKFPEFKRDKYAEGDTLWHIASHADHDDEHAKSAAAALSGLTGTLGSWHESIEHGIQGAFHATENFWNLLSERFFGCFHSTDHYGKNLETAAT